MSRHPPGGRRAPARLFELSSSRRRFRRPFIEGHHPFRKRVVTALPPTSPGSRRLLLAAHSLSLAFEAPHGPDEAPDTTPAAREAPRLVIGFVHQVTSLEGDTPRTMSALCPRLPPGHSHRGLRFLRARAFGGQKLEAPPYPQAPGFRGSAPSLDELTGKGFCLRPFRG